MRTAVVTLLFAWLVVAAGGCGLREPDEGPLQEGIAARISSVQALDADTFEVVYELVRREQGYWILRPAEAVQIRLYANGSRLPATQHTLIPIDADFLSGTADSSAAIVHVDVPAEADAVALSLGRSGLVTEAVALR